MHAYSRLHCHDAHGYSRLHYYDEHAHRHGVRVRAHHDNARTHDVHDHHAHDHNAHYDHGDDVHALLPPVHGVLLPSAPSPKNLSVRLLLKWPLH